MMTRTLSFVVSPKGYAGHGGTYVFGNMLNAEMRKWLENR